MSNEQETKTMICPNCNLVLTMTWNMKSLRWEALCHNCHRLHIDDSMIKDRDVFIVEVSKLAWKQHLSHDASNQLSRIIIECETKKFTPDTYQVMMLDIISRTKTILKF